MGDLTGFQLDSRYSRAILTCTDDAHASSIIAILIETVIIGIFDFYNTISLINIRYYSSEKLLAMKIIVIVSDVEYDLRFVGDTNTSVIGNTVKLSIFIVLVNKTNVDEMDDTQLVLYYLSLISINCNLLDTHAHTI